MISHPTRHRISIACCALILPLLTACGRAQDATPPALLAKKPKTATFLDTLTFDRRTIDRTLPSPISFAPMLKLIRPSIVTIQTGIKQLRRQLSLSREDRRLLQLHGFRFPNEKNSKEAETWQQIGVGSGVIVTTDGYIITNRHVIIPEDLNSLGMTLQDYFDSLSLRIMLPGSEGWKNAQLVDFSRQKDIAVLKMEGTGYPAARIANSDSVEVGDQVFALGAPYGISETVTLGIVSAKRNDEVLEGFDKQELIQTDASINPGNSGGPLVDVEGRVIGINTVIYSRTGSNHGIGFAIPINNAVDAADALSRPRGYLGTELRGVNQRAARIYGFKGGAFIEALTKQSPADLAGLAPGDVILSFGGEAIKNEDDLRARIEATAPGTKVGVEVFRNEKKGEFTIVIGERDNAFDIKETKGAPTAQQQKLQDSPPAPRAASSDLLLAKPSSEELSKLQLPADSAGLIIKSVAANTPAAAAGLSPGQLILKINGSAPTDPTDAQKQLTTPPTGPTTLQIRDEDETRLITIEP